DTETRRGIARDERDERDEVGRSVNRSSGFVSPCLRGSDSAAQEASALEKRCQELEAAIAEVEPLVADGRLYREDLKAEIRRLAGIVQAEKESELILKAAEKFDCTQLKALVREYDTRAEKLFPPKGV